jgi:hypothetical protein
MVARPPRFVPPHDAASGASSANAAALYALLGRLPNRPGPAHPTKVVREAVLARSRHLREPEYRILDTDDLELIFRLYDEHAFDGLLAELLPPRPTSLWFRLSKRMTKSAGKTTFRLARVTGAEPAALTGVEIAISAPLLLYDLPPGGGASVVGLTATDRLDALQRVMEHELLHLFEHLTCGRSRCSGARFQTMAKQFFGHLGHEHSLRAPALRAAGAPGEQASGSILRRGQRVRFRFEGARHEGVVNRITRRVTVLVPDPAGCRYSDGECYRKYYVPLSLIERVPEA